jgi:sterol desaturase/sphingolipid hydroxylase (fatty acid hydroxylase superfamily)
MGAAIAGFFALLVYLERRRALRDPTQPKLERTVRNLAIAATAGLVMLFVERPLVLPLTNIVERKRWGLMFSVPLPNILRVVVSVLLLDYTLYVWHVLTHRVPMLWRFHLVHHVDLDLDASTALRFHAGELLLSVPWRLAQVLVIGVSPAALITWQNALFFSILFHHSNVRLPLMVEKRLNALIVTPRMHGIHHDAFQAHTNSNWSSGLTVWDRLHGTLLLDVPQSAVTIGVPAYRDPTEITLARSLALPFKEQRQAWL